jgi:shikimate dehydrogenase
MEITGATRVFALLGDPVAHSLSPVMYNAAFRALGLDAVYVATRCSGEAIEALMQSLVRQGGGGNVTIPHKAKAAEALVRLGGPVLEVCNTFWGNGTGVTGAETDSHGILAALAELGARDGNWLLVGTGGSARAALGAAQRVGARVAVRSRSPERARELLAVARAMNLPEAEAATCDVVINCTPLGLSPSDPLPLEPSRVPARAAVLDLVYRRGETPWVRALREGGRRAADGRTVLVEQGAVSFEHWFETLPAPREVMRAAVRRALG